MPHPQAARRPECRALFCAFEARGDRRYCSPACSHAAKRYLIHDRDLLYADKFDSVLKAVGVNPVKLPARSPNLNSYAERFVKSIKEEYLKQLILSFEEQPRHDLSEYSEYFHRERIPHGINRIIEPQHKENRGRMICIERLGGLLKSYHRQAA